MMTADTQSKVRTNFARAAQGYDSEFAAALADEICKTIANASRLTDAPMLAIRTGETMEALISALVAVGSFCPAFDQPRQLRLFADALRKRLIKNIGRARASPPPEAERMFGFRSGGSA